MGIVVIAAAVIIGIILPFGGIVAKFLVEDGAATGANEVPRCGVGVEIIGSRIANGARRTTGCRRGGIRPMVFVVRIAAAWNSFVVHHYFGLFIMLLYDVWLSGSLHSVSIAVSLCRL